MVWHLLSLAVSALVLALVFCVVASCERIAFYWPGEKNDALFFAAAGSVSASVALGLTALAVLLWGHA